MKGKVEQYGLTDEYERFEQVQKAAKCYSAWSNFNYSEALDYTEFEFYKNHHDILSKLSKYPEQTKTAEGAIYQAMDRWMRGKDFFKKDLDKAALCFTQAFEVLSEFRLWDMCNNDKVTPNFDCGEIHFDVSKVVKFIYEGKSQENKCEAGKKNFSWIAGREDRFKKKSEPSLGLIIKVLGTRNDLAHFNCFNVAEYDTNKIKVEELKDVSENYIELFINIYNIKDSKEKCRSFFEHIKDKLSFARFEDF